MGMIEVRAARATDALANAKGAFVNVVTGVPWSRTRACTILTVRSCCGMRAGVLWISRRWGKIEKAPLRNFWWSLCVAVLLSSSFSRAQARNEGAPLKVTMCDLYNDPQKYAGKMIEVRATIAGYRDPKLEQPAFAPQEPCAASGYMTIGLELPQNAKPKPKFDLIRDESFQKYAEALQKPMRIEATLEGRFDPTFIWRNHKRERVGEGEGYGKQDSEDGRLVLYRMSDVETKYIPRK